MADEQDASHRIGVARLIIGAMQGAVLYGLYSAADAHSFPATNPSLFVPLTLVAFFVPLILLQGLTAMRLRTLLVWVAGAAIILAALGFYDVYREWPAATVASQKGLSDANQPSAPLIFFSAAALFIAHALIAGADSARKRIAPYSLYFEAAWKQGVQLALSLGFTGVFWLVLLLGANLFKLIEIDFLSRIIEKAWFAIPATAIALSVAAHIADVRENMVVAVRSIVLALLSWLLPLMAFFAGGFLIALVFTGLEPLWKTRTAAAILLVASGALVIFINAAFQDGAKPMHKVLRIAACVAGIALLPLAFIAAYAIYLRVSQYGWTGDRIAATAITLVALLYAGGYLGAALDALRGKGWSKTVETTNIAAAFLVVVVIFALFSPIADPARIGVASQVARLESGKVTPAQFDFNYLRRDGERFGHAALTRLAASKNKEIALRAGDALKGLYQTVKPPAPGDVARQIKVYPSDRKLPEALLKQGWDMAKAPNLPPCLTNAGIDCEAFAIDLNGDGRDEYLFIWGEADNGWDATVMAQGEKSVWYPAATLPWPHCKAARDAFRKGQYAVVAPRMAWRGIDAGETNFQVQPLAPPTGCGR